MSIIVNNITKVYGAQKALNNVSFEIKSGEIVGLLGPNGAGKSTMMKIITCFIPPTSGEASVCGYDIYEDSKNLRKKVGYLPENNPLYHDMYVREYLEFISGVHKMNKRTRDIIGDMIQTTALSAEQNKKIGALSKGYRQRIGLAQALIHDPDVLILDEPTSGLDPNQLVEMRNLIKEIGKEKTVMLSTHIMQEVEAVCDRAIIINKGEIVADDSTSKLITATANVEIIKVEFSTPVDEIQLKSINGVLEVSKIDENIWDIKSVSDKDIRPDIFQFAVSNNYTVLSMSKVEQSLEDIFRQLTQDNLKI
ncbi:MAG: gliding motility-associated ABC transporter ATP-binding subunit GldA [Bacteroidales bacterium]|nr:gliding motility-associated ABC transporter ATP-binding subunit GldA [Bacteroidales bacterium]